MSKTLKVKVRDRWFTVEVGDLTGNPVRVLVDGDPVDVDLEGLGREEKPSLPVPQPSEASPVSGREANPSAKTTPTTPSATKTFRSPMPGVILSVSVKIGDQVVTGDEVCVLEAMKMQQVLRADWTGIVRAIHVEPGQQVLDGAPIAELE